MADVPAARELLQQALKFEMQDEARTLIREALELMYRDFIGRRAPTKSRTITPETVRLIKRYADQYPHDSYQQIANVFEVNQGRVSEILAGKHD